MHAGSHRRAVHRSVLVTLVAWLLALMAGVANACLLDDREAGHGAQGQPFVHEATHAACNDASESAAYSVARQEGSDSNPVGAAALQPLSAGPTRVLVLSIAQARGNGAHSHGPPDAIRYLRLRL